MAKVALQADSWYNEDLKAFDRSGAGNTLRPEHNLFERSRYGYFISFNSAWQATPYSPLGSWRDSTMPAPKDPQKYEEWRKGISQRNKGRRHTQEARDKISAANHRRTYGPRSDECKAKMSASTKGRKLSDEHRAKLSAAGKGRKISEEQKEKLSIARTGYKMSEEQKQKLSIAGKKRKLSESHKARLVAANTGRPMPEEHKAKLTAINKGKEVSAEVREKLSKASKAYYDSLSEEERDERYQKWRDSVQTKDTSIERYIAQLLGENSIEHEQQKRIGRYYVDFFLPSSGIVIETYGCWWHACDPCGFNHTAYSADKRVRDEKRISYIESKGYTVIIIWEHDLLPFMKAEVRDTK